MTTPGDDAREPRDGDETTPTAGPAPRHRRVLLAALAAIVLLAGLGLAVVLVGQDEEDLDPFAPEAPAVASMRMKFGDECVYDPDRGGLVSSLDVSSRDAGRFSVELWAVTEEDLDAEDITTPHKIRVSVPFHGGRTRMQFDVVIPLTEAEYRAGYRECRWQYGRG